MGPTTPAKRRVWASPLSLATTKGIAICFLFLPLLRCFSWGSSLHTAYVLGGESRVKREGLPHSEISGSKLVVSSPKLIADFHVLHRPREPRHPPDALIRSMNSESGPQIAVSRENLLSVYCLLLSDLLLSSCQGANCGGPGRA